jgi:hypothetical protein
MLPTAARFDVIYKTVKVGEYVPDLIAADKIIVDKKVIDQSLIMREAK